MRARAHLYRQAASECSKRQMPPAASRSRCCAQSAANAVGWILHVARCILRVAFCILHVAFCILHVAFCILHVAFCTLHVAFCTLHSAPCTLHSAPCTLHSAGCILHVAFCTLPASYACCSCMLHVGAWHVASGRSGSCLWRPDGRDVRRTPLLISHTRKEQRAERRRPPPVGIT